MVHWNLDSNPLVIGIDLLYQAAVEQAEIPGVIKYNDPLDETGELISFNPLSELKPL
jgi:hypothetical protein